MTNREILEVRDMTDLDHGVYTFIMEKFKDVFMSGFLMVVDDMSITNNRMTTYSFFRGPVWERRYFVLKVIR